MGTSLENTVDRDVIEADNAFLKQMIDLIPPHFYFDNDTKEEIHDMLEDDEDRKPERGVGSIKKRHSSSQELSEKAKWKRAKLDPMHLKTVTEIQAKLMQHDSNEQETRKQKTKKHHKKTEEGESDEEGKEGDSLEDDEDTGLGSSIDSCEDLRERLRAKIEMLQARRKNLSRDSSVEKKRLARKVSKMKLKLRRKTEKQNKVKGQHTAPTPKKTPKKTPAAKPIFNKEGKIVFSKFDFTDVDGGKKEKKGSDVLTGKNYKKLLEKVEKRKEKLTQVREKAGCGAARTLQKKMQWQTVLQKAEGVKVRDDPELLRKSLKKKEKRQEKHAQQWKERTDRVQKKQKDHQEKRKRNIQKKKQSRIDKKINRSKKKGHIIPGF